MKHLFANLVAFLAVLFLSNTSYSDFAPTPFPSKCPKQMIGDLSGNKKLGPEDMRLWSQQWARLRAGKTVSACVLILMNTDDLPKITKRDFEILGHAVARYTKKLPVRMGDSNGDNVLSQIDYNFYYGVLERYITPNALQILLGDMNGDGRLTGIDLSILRDRLTTPIGEICGTGPSQNIDFSFADEMDAKKACGCPVPTPTALPFNASFIKEVTNATFCESPPSSPAKIAAPARLQGIDDAYEVKYVHMADQTTGKAVLDKYLAGLVKKPEGGMAIALTSGPKWTKRTLNRESIIIESCPALTQTGCRSYSVQLFLAGPADEPDIHLFEKERNGILTFGNLGESNGMLIATFLKSSDDPALNKRRFDAWGLFLGALSRHERIHERDMKGMAHAWEHIVNNPRYSSNIEICDDGDFTSDKERIHTQVINEANEVLQELLTVHRREETECSRRFHEQEYKPGGYVKTLIACLKEGGPKCNLIGTEQMPKPIYDDVPECLYTTP